MPPSTIADAANTNANTAKPSCRRPISARIIDGCSPGAGSGMRARYVTSPSTIATTASPAHTTSPRRAEPNHHPRRRRAEHARRVPQSRGTAPAARARARASAAAVTLITTSMSPPAAIAERERGREQTQVRGERLHRDERAPDDERPRERYARAPAVGDDPAYRGDAGPVRMPAASRSPSPVSERSNDRSMSIAATANAPPKNPNTTKAEATGRNEDRTPQSRAAVRRSLRTMELSMTPEERLAFISDTPGSASSASRRPIGDRSRIPFGTRVEADRTITFAVGEASRKTELLRAAGRATMCVQSEVAPYSYVTMEGPVTEIGASTDESRLERAHRYLGKEFGDMYFESTQGRSRHHLRAPAPTLGVDRLREALRLTRRQR